MNRNCFCHEHLSGVAPVEPLDKVLLRWCAHNPCSNLLLDETQTRKKKTMKDRMMKNEKHGRRWACGFGRLTLLILGLSMVLGFSAVAQNPEMIVRFANPVFDCDADTYCVDVEIMSGVSYPGPYELYGMNVRFFYDSTVLLFNAMNDFQGGYGVLGNTSLTTGGPSSGSLFGFGPTNPATFVNGAMH